MWGVYVCALLFFRKGHGLQVTSYVDGVVNISQRMIKNK